MSSSGEAILYLVASMVIQTLVFGAYTVLIILSTRMLIRGLKTPTNMILLIITGFMYLLSAAYWFYRFADIMNRVQIYTSDLQNLPEPSTWFTLFNAVVLVNYILSDGVVWWRARLICSPDRRKYMYFPLLFVVLTFISAAALIGLRITAFFSLELQYSGAFLEAINTLQIAGLGLSLISNVSATGIVGIAAWRHRKTIRVAFHKPTQGYQIMRLLLESGILYCISGVIVLASSLIRLPYNTLGDLYSPINIQIAGAYTPVVLLLVSAQRGLGETSFLGTIPDLEIPISAASPVVSNRIILSNTRSSTWSGESLNVEADTRLNSKGNESEKGHRYHVSDATLV
ncbi:hypothetical protein DFH07DRAFT_168485 [Mycena maculata]|uniref:Uncharacterized protein n=1 Tax=Mycena maculata TaxID=230809 RepID=A0AAD7JV62_9AGAR|nr:hypothetical protein DFH07DRAFT_168485 [Mycena maculata]